MKRMYKMLVLGIILVVLTAAYLVVLYFNGKSTEADYVNKFDSDTVSEISWNTGESNILFDKTENGWIYPENDEIEIDGTKVDDIVAKISNLTATYKIDDVTDFSQYGFENPYKVIQVTFADGNKAEYIIGDVSALLDERYAMISGQNTVFLIDYQFAESFVESIQNFAIRDDE